MDISGLVEWISNELWIETTMGISPRDQSMWLCV